MEVAGDFAGGSEEGLHKIIRLQCCTCIVHAPPADLNSSGTESTPSVLNDGMSIPIDGGFEK